jgi:hypothetical protein
MRRRIGSASAANLRFRDRAYLTIWFNLMGKSPFSKKIFWEIFLAPRDAVIPASSERVDHQRRFFSAWR